MVLAASSEPLGFPTRTTALHVDDLAFAEGDDLIALDVLAALVLPNGRADDPVVPDQCELGRNAPWLAAALLDLETQDLTGLVRSASGRGVFPPEVAVGDATPLGIVGEKRRQRRRVTLVQRLGRSTELIDHRRGPIRGTGS